MTITVRFKHYHTIIAGKEEVTVQLPGGSNLGDLICKLKEMLPELFPEANKASYSINSRLAGPDTILTNGNVVNMLTIIMGG